MLTLEAIREAENVLRENNVPMTDSGHYLLNASEADIDRLLNNVGRIGAVRSDGALPTVAPEDLGYSSREYAVDVRAVIFSTIVCSVRRLPQKTRRMI